MSEPIPSASVPAVDNRGYFSPAWARFFASIVSRSAAFAGITGGTFKASDDGSIGLSVSGGAVSSVTITRGGASVTIAGPIAFVPVSSGDQVSWAATGTVTATFIPT